MSESEAASAAAAVPAAAGPHAAPEPAPPPPATTPPPRLPHIVPRTMPGGLQHVDARAPIDWGWQGLVAYGCNSTAVVVDPATQQVVQTLHKHTTSITKLKWQRSQLDARFAYRAVLATADAGGLIAVWDVREGFCSMLLQEGTKPINELSWVYRAEGSGHLLLALHAPGSLILWDTDSGSKLWRCGFNETVLSFDLDPFDTRRLAMLCSTSILLVEDFSVSERPSGSGSRLPLSSIVGGNGTSSTPATPTYDEKSTRDKLKRKVLDLVTGDIPGPEEGAVGAGDCVQLSYLPHCRHALLLALPRRLLLLDARLSTPIASLAGDKAGSPLTQVLPCARSEALFTLSESGVVALRACGGGGEPLYECRAQTGAPRLTRQLRACGAALEPAAERRLALLLSDGRMLFWELPETSGKLQLSGLLTPGPAQPTVIRMCPPLTTKNWQEFVPRLACGTSSGALVILDVASGCVESELAVHSCAVRGVEWCSLTTLLSWARPGSGPLRNELSHVDVRSGQWTPLRQERTDQQPIAAVRVSHLKQYFLVTFGEQPAELWELATLTPLRTLPGRFPPLTALAWSPVHNVRKQASLQHRLLAKEHFVFTDPSGQMYHFSVEGSQVLDGTRIPADPAVRTVTDMAWKGQQLVLGDSEGQLCVWELTSKRSHTLATHRGSIKKLKFAPGRGNMKLLALVADGLEIWDTRTDERIGQLRTGREAGGAAVDCDWAASDKPVLLTADHCVRVLDLELASCCSPTDMYQYREPVCYPCLMSLGSVSALEQHLFNATDGPYTGDDTGVRQWVAAVPARLLSWLADPAAPPEQRGLVAAHLLGNESAARLWRVAAHHLNRHPDTADSEPAAYIGADFDLLCDSEAYREVTARRLRQRLAVLRVSPSPEPPRQRAAAASAELVRQLVLLGETETAAQALLDTDPAEPDYYTNCLRACVLAGGRQAADGGGLTKLVATSLIAAEHVYRGVEMLVAAGQQVDGCRYLQASGRWEEAAQLARCTLPPQQAQAVLTKHAQHLSSAGREREAVMFLLSVGQFARAAELVRRRDFHLYALLEKKGTDIAAQ